MLDCTHIIENRIYLISSKSVAGIKIFNTPEFKFKMRSKIESYLSKICKLIHIEICKDEFHIVLQLKERDSISNFYRQKNNGKFFEDFFIPESTYIFGRQMSNMLVSFVKAYNYKFKRSGVLMDGRYRRKLIETKEEMESIIAALKLGEYSISDRKRKSGLRGRNNGRNWVSEGVKRKEGDFTSLIYKGLGGIDIYLRGCFGKPQKLSLVPPQLSEKIKIYRANFPCGPNYN